MIRKAELNDLFEISNIEREELGESLGVDFLTNELTLNKDSLYFVYTIDETLIGYIGFRIYDEEAEMMNFVITKKHQNKGYGTDLLNYFIKISKIYNISRISLEVRETNTKAIKFYKKHNFVKTRVKNNYYKNEDAFVLYKEV